jgi:SAM-dependent methyltransferase
MIAFVRRVLHPIFARSPRVRSRALAAIDIAARPVLLFFRLDRPRSDAAGAARLESRTDEFNKAAETYYAQHTNLAQLLEKPFSEPDALPKRLVDVGVLIDGLRLRPGDTVLELGAGTCWLSHLLNRFGCRTIAVDVSRSALAMGRQLFERDPRTNWQLDPQFLSYDGHKIPLPDGSVDRIVLYDAYHHLPNPSHLMREMRRLLTADGIVGMSEPGRGHAASAPSEAEAAATGVLENELALEDIAEVALSCGFAAARVVIANRLPVFEIEAADLRPFMGGKGFARYWQALTAGLDGHHYILLFAGDPVPTTRRPKLLRARLGPSPSVRMRHGMSGRLTLSVHNAGDTRWLAAENSPGWTRLGAHLYRVLEGPEGRVPVDFDWLRVALPSDVAPDGMVRLSIQLPAIERPGEYLLVFDLVIEGVAWFADRGSMRLEVPCRVV